MKRMDIQCLFVGKQSTLYSNLVRSLCKFDLNVRVKLVDAEKDHVLFALKKLRGAGLVFISEDVPFSLDVLADLIWQYAPDAVVVVLTVEKKTTSIASNASNVANENIYTKFSRLHYESDSSKTQLFLQCLIQTIRFKTEFRRCKRLLGISEKRCLWLVESSQEAIAYITRDLHLFSNSSYLKLFNAESTEKLRSISIQELIGSNEYSIFERFLESQLRHCDANRSIVLTMLKTNGVSFRANIHLIPSVYKGKKCLQLWVGKVEKLYDLQKINLTENADKKEAIGDKLNLKLEKNSQPLIDKYPKNEQQTPPNPFSVLNERTQVESPKIDQSVIIVELIKRKEAKLFVQKLVKFNKKENTAEHHLLSLVVNDEEKEGVNSLLFEPQTATTLKQQSIFWDKVKFTRLFQVLRKKSKLDVFLIVDISAASISDRMFTQWFFFELANIGVKSSHLVLLFPSELNNAEKTLAIDFSKKLRARRCKIALGNCSISKEVLSVLVDIRAEYIRFSSEWLKQLEGNNNREIMLGGAIRKFESKGIKVISPCRFSSHLRKFFALSGASFCQEKVQ